MTTLLCFINKNYDPCRLLIRNLQRAYLPIPVQYIDVTVSPNQQTLYNVTVLPTMILLDNNSNEIKRTLGNKPSAYIQSWIITN